MSMKLKNKNILVTGGAGFIGFHIAKKLLQLGARIVIVDNLNSYYDPSLKKTRLRELRKIGFFKFYKCDISNFSGIEKIFKKERIDLICHQAAQAGVRYSLQNPLIYGKSNLEGTLNILELAKKYNIKGIVFASSSSVYGANKKVPFREDYQTDSPISLYAATKKSCELLAFAYHKVAGLNITVLRYFTVYGPFGRPDMAFFKFTEAILSGSQIQMYNFGKMKRSFTYIDDIVAGVIKALEKNYPFEIFNLGAKETISLRKFISIIEKNIGKRAKIKLFPLQKGDPEKTAAEISKAKRLLDWEPKVSIEEGLRNFVTWYRDYYNR